MMCKHETFDTFSDEAGNDLVHWCADCGAVRWLKGYGNDMPEEYSRWRSPRITRTVGLLAKARVLIGTRTTEGKE